MPGVMDVPCAVRAAVTAAAGIKLVGVPQPKPLHEFSPNFQGCLPQDDLELIRYWGYLVTTVAMGTRLRFLGLKLCGYSTD